MSFGCRVAVEFKWGNGWSRDGGWSSPGSPKAGAEDLNLCHKMRKFNFLEVIGKIRKSATRYFYLGLVGSGRWWMVGFGNKNNRAIADDSDDINYSRYTFVLSAPPKEERSNCDLCGRQIFSSAATSSSSLSFYHISTPSPTPLYTWHNCSRELVAGDVSQAGR